MRAAFFLVSAAVLALLVVAAGGKLALEAAADTRAQSIANELLAGDQPLDAIAVELTRRVHGWYQQKSAVEEPPLLWRLRPYLTHEVLPEPFRLPEGVIDTLYAEGMCDDAVRTLVYILGALGIKGEQLNIVNRFTGAHSVVLAFLPNGREVMLDPTYGVVAKYKGELVSPGRAFLIAGHQTGGVEVWHALTPLARLGFYRHPEHAVFAVQNAGLEIVASVHLGASGRLLLGQADGDTRDVHVDGFNNQLTHLWTYLGHKYDRGWVRVLTFAQDTRLKIGLVEPIESGFITTDVEPRIEGKTLIYDVSAGQSLRFVDGLAKRDWTRLRSYQDIDYIIFEPMS